MDELQIQPSLKQQRCGVKTKTQTKTPVKFLCVETPGGLAIELCCGHITVAGHGVNVPRVRARRGRGQRAFPRTRSITSPHRRTPQFLTLEIHGNQQHLLIELGHGEHLAGKHNRRGGTGALDRQFPEHVLFLRPFSREIFLHAHTIMTRSAPVRPVNRGYLKSEN